MDITDPQALESMLRETAGVPVTVQGTDTWAHRDMLSELAVSEETGFEDRPGGADEAVVLATGIPPNPLETGMAITVDGESLQILDHRRVEDGALTAIVVGTWSHTVDIYRPPTDGDTTRGQQQQQFDSPIASSVSCDLMARSGDIRAQESGDRSAAEWEGHFPPGTDIQPGDRLKVTAGTGPERWKVVFVGDRTDRWKIPVELTESDEDFG